MKKQNENQYDIDAKKEPHITAEDLAVDIKPLLKDYFKGDIMRNGGSIIYKMLNGQVFLITAQEIK